MRKYCVLLQYLLIKPFLMAIIRRAKELYEKHRIPEGQLMRSFISLLTR